MGFKYFGEGRYFLFSDFEEFLLVFRVVVVVLIFRVVGVIEVFVGRGSRFWLLRAFFFEERLVRMEVRIVV